MRVGEVWRECGTLGGFSAGEGGVCDLECFGLTCKTVGWRACAGYRDGVLGKWFERIEVFPRKLIDRNSTFGPPARRGRRVAAKSGIDSGMV